MTAMPRRRQDLEIHEADDGLVVYDVTNNRVHHLNASAAAVLALCTGTLTLDAIAREIGRAFATASLPTADVEACVAELTAQSLLDAAASE